MNPTAKHTPCPAQKVLSMLLDRLDCHGGIDHIREEGPIADARLAIERPCNAPALVAALRDLDDEVFDASQHDYDTEHQRRLAVACRKARAALAQAEGGSK